MIYVTKLLEAPRAKTVSTRIRGSKKQGSMGKLSLKFIELNHPDFHVEYLNEMFIV